MPRLPVSIPARDTDPHKEPLKWWNLAESRVLLGVVITLAACLALALTRLTDGRTLRGPSKPVVVATTDPRVTADAPRPAPAGLTGSGARATQFPVGYPLAGSAMSLQSSQQDYNMGVSPHTTPATSRRSESAEAARPGGSSTAPEAAGGRPTWGGESPGTAAGVTADSGSKGFAAGSVATQPWGPTGSANTKDPSDASQGHQGGPAPGGQAAEAPVLPLDAPWRIAHRGASADLPEHTREAYELAIAEGADFIECDVVLTRDLVPLCRHEPNLATSTDAPAKFPDRWRTYTIDGVNVTGIFSVDLTAEEVASLRAVQPWPFRNQSYNGLFRVATLADYLDVARSASRSVGIYPETKHPSWTNSLPPLTAAGVRLEDILLSALEAAGFTAPLGSPAWRQRPVFLQSFEAQSLQYMAARSCAPAVLLLGEWEGWVAPDSGLSLQQLTSDTSLVELAQWAAAVGPNKETLVDWREGQHEGGGGRERDSDGGGAGGNGGGGRYVSSGLVERFHAHGLQVHTYTLRPEPRFFLPHLADQELTRPGPGPGSAEAGPRAGAQGVNVSAEYSLVLGGPGGAVRVDGVFADHMPSLVDWLRTHGPDTSAGSDWAASRHGGVGGQGTEAFGLGQHGLTQEGTAQQGREPQQDDRQGEGESVRQRALGLVGVAGFEAARGRALRGSRGLHTGLQGSEGLEQGGKLVAPFRQAEGPVAVEGSPSSSSSSSPSSSTVMGTSAGGAPRRVWSEERGCWLYRP